MSELITNNGAVADLRQSFQLDGGSQDKCGPWSVAELKYAGLPGKGPMGTAKEVGKWGSDEYIKHIGLDIPSDTAGSSIENMHQFFHDAGNLHYWDMDAIAPSSAQSSDLAHVRRALAAGYPVVVTVNEQSVISKKLGKCPYPWQPRLGPVNHIFSIVGVDKDGDFICADEVNNQESSIKQPILRCIGRALCSLLDLTRVTRGLSPFHQVTRPHGRKALMHKTLEIRRLPGKGRCLSFRTKTVSRLLLHRPRQHSMRLRPYWLRRRQQPSSRLLRRWTRRSWRQSRPRSQYSSHSCTKTRAFPPPGDVPRGGKAAKIILSMYISVIFPWKYFNLSALLPIRLFLSIHSWLGYSIIQQGLDFFQGLSKPCPTNHR